MEENYKNTFDRMKNDGSVGIVMFNSYVFGLKYEDGKLHFGNVYDYSEFVKCGNDASNLTPLVPERLVDINEEVLEQVFDKALEKYIEKYVYPLYQNTTNTIPLI